MLKDHKQQENLKKATKQYILTNSGVELNKLLKIGHNIHFKDWYKIAYKINETKKRVKNEFEKYGAFCWITKGKEIENYLEKEAIEEAFGKKIGKQCEQYQLFPEYIEPICSTFKKVEFAQKVVPYVIQERASKMLDLEKQVKSLYAVIKKWNQK